MTAPPGRALSFRVIARGLLTAVSLVALLPAAFAILGGYFIRMPVVGPFGTVLNTGYPWVLGAVVVTTAMLAAVVALGGQKTRVLLAISLALLGAAGYIGYRYASFATDHGATYDLIRAADGFPPLKEDQQRVTFANLEGHDLQADLWFPDGAAEAAPSSFAAVVFVHGGAFQGGFPGTRPFTMVALDRAGIVAIDIDYRLAPPPRWHDAPADVLCALAWVRSAPELTMVDPDRVVLVGESAGGSLALVAGYAAGTDKIESSCPERGEPIVPAGIFVIAPTADLRGIYEDETISDFVGGPFPKGYIGGSPDEYPDRYDAAEPFWLLRPDLPPTVLLTGEIDRLVLIERQISTVERIRASGAEIELLNAPFAGHGFDGEPSSFGAQLVETILPAFVRRVAG